LSVSLFLRVTACGFIYSVTRLLRLSRCLLLLLLIDIIDALYTNTHFWNCMSLGVTDLQKEGRWTLMFLSIRLLCNYIPPPLVMIWMTPLYYPPHLILIVTLWLVLWSLFVSLSFRYLVITILNWIIDGMNRRALMLVSLSFSNIIPGCSHVQKLNLMCSSSPIKKWFCTPGRLLENASFLTMESKDATLPPQQSKI